METMNIAIPPLLKEFVQLRVERGGYGSVSEYVRELIRLDQRQSAQSELENELLRGLASGPPVKMTKATWSALREDISRRLSSSKKP